MRARGMSNGRKHVFKKKSDYVHHVMIKAVFFDADGVLYRGGKAIDEMVEAIRELQEKGVLTFVLTNNSTKSRTKYEKRLRAMGIPFPRERIISSAFMVAELISQKKDEARVFIIGEEGLREELELKGHHVLHGQEEQADFVVVGLDRGFTYEKLAHAYSHILNGARFYATNTDASLPGENQSLPGAGSMVSALKTCAQMGPELIAGKPSVFMYKKALALANVKPHEAIMVGDRIETDIQGALNAGVNAFIALTGVTSKKQAVQYVNSWNPRGTSPWVRILESTSEIVRTVSEKMHEKSNGKD